MSSRAQSPAPAPLDLKSILDSVQEAQANMPTKPISFDDAAVTYTELGFVPALALEMASVEGARLGAAAVKQDRLTSTIASAKRRNLPTDHTDSMLRVTVESLNEQIRKDKGNGSCATVTTMVAARAATHVTTTQQTVGMQPMYATFTLRVTCTVGQTTTSDEFPMKTRSAFAAPPHLPDMPSHAFEFPLGWYVKHAPPGY